MSEPALALEKVSAGYNDTRVLHDVTLTVPVGERLALIGRNGVGKTTMMATIMGLTKVHGGAIRLNGEDITRTPTIDAQCAAWAWSPQTRNIFPSLSVEENLRSALRGDATVEEAYALFPRLKERRRNGGAQLSGGEQQMLAVARTPDVAADGASTRRAAGGPGAGDPRNVDAGVRAACSRPSTHHRAGPTAMAKNASFCIGTSSMRDGTALVAYAYHM